MTCHGSQGDHREVRDGNVENPRYAHSKELTEERPLEAYAAEPDRHHGVRTPQVRQQEQATGGE
jgi:hypothetical protein